MPYANTIDFEILVMHFLIQKYTWSRLLWFMYLFSDLEVYLKVDFQNFCIYRQTQKYTWVYFLNFKCISFETQK